MQKISLILIFLKIIAFSTYSQSSENSIKNTIELLFTGMRKADSALVSQTLASHARLLTVVEQAGTTRVRETPIATFLEAIALPRTEVWDERILTYDIRVDDQLATVWTPYRFYRDTTFSHCGVNAFQLYYSDRGWKILQIVDTRRKENCPE